MTASYISSILSKGYEQRTQKEHEALVSALRCYFPDFKSEKLKLLSFFIKKVQGNQKIAVPQYSQFSYILNPFVYQQRSSQIFRSYQMLTANKQIIVQNGSIAAVLDYREYMNCQALGDVSIQQEISSFCTSQYLCTLPKKTLFWLLRNATIQNYKQNQTVYLEGQDIVSGEAGSGVYIVRDGQFTYIKYFPKQNKQIEVFKFGKGNIFGTIDIERDVQNGKYPKRLFTVTCKSSKSVIYKITKQAFIEKIKPHCQAILIKKQIKLIKFIQPKDNYKLHKSKQLNEVNPPFGSTGARLTKGFYSTRQYHYSNKDHDPFLETQYSLKRTQSNPINAMNLTKKYDSFGKTSYSKAAHNTLYGKIENKKCTLPGLSLNPRYSEQFATQSAKKISYLSLKKEGPLKQVPMVGRRSSFIDSQFKHLQFEKDPEQKRALPVKLQNSVHKGDFIFRLLMKNQSMPYHVSKNLQKKTYI